MNCKNTKRNNEVKKGYLEWKLLSPLRQATQKRYKTNMIAGLCVSVPTFMTSYAKKTESSMFMLIKDLPESNNLSTKRFFVVSSTLSANILYQRKAYFWK